jgi:hypothetical protein
MAPPRPTASVSDLTRLGVARATAECVRCRHVAEISLDRFRPDEIFATIRTRLTCSACGGRDITWSPDWRDYRPTGRI